MLAIGHPVPTAAIGTDMTAIGIPVSTTTIGADMPRVDRNSQYQSKADCH